MHDIFIRRLVELMEEKDMSQTELSHLVGTTNVTISRYISGERKPRIEIVAKIAEVLGTSVDYLLGISNVKKFTERKFTDSKTSMPYKSIYNKLNEISKTISNKQLSKEQILIIEKLLDTNQELISKFDSEDKNIS